MLDPEDRNARGRGRACALAGSLALVLAALSLWPGASVPAWPAASLGLLAWAVAALGPAPVVPKAVGTITAFVALVAATAQIGLLWLLAEAVA